LLAYKKHLALLMRKSAYLLLFFFLLCLHVSVLSQISAAHVTGCAPLVQDSFKGIIGSSNILWNFGDGSSATLLNPVHTYASPGSYNVTYTATVGGSPITQTLTVVVHGKPTPLFTAAPPVKGCIPLAVTFHDNSTGGGGSPIVSWQWAYGDGGINSTNAANQTYTYTVGGQFSVTVKVTDANGCDSSLTIPNLINVSQKPTIVLTTSPNPAASCLPPLTVTFTSTGTTSHSTTNPALTYLWNFGSGTSTVANPPSQTYTTTGVFPVKLIVTDNNNCSDTVTRNVIIQNPHASFSTNDTVCLRTSFTNTSTGGSVFVWDYGDGTTGAISTHTYTASGYYPVKLTVYNGSCFDDTTITVYVEKPVANFSFSPTYMCKLPKVITLNNMSTPTGGSTYQWGFWENYTQYVFSPTGSISVNPSFTITNIDTNRYSIYSLNDHDSITLTITTARGCKDHLKIYFADSIFLPTARYMPDIYEGCVPLTVHFYDSSRSKEPITLYDYNFGDGSPHVTGNPNPVHTYTNTGIYYPTLIIHNAGGCGDTSYRIKIQVGRPPAASFSLTPTNICIGDTVHFTDTTPASDSVDSWHYYGDGGFFASACYNTPNSGWPFTHATGPQTVSLVACFRGCCDTSTQTNAVTVKGPLGTFIAAMDCDSPMVYTFTGTFSDAQNWTWNFGDGNTVATTTVTTEVHTYTATGDYMVHLTSFNGSTGCNPYKDSIKIHVRNIEADFLFDTLLCTSVGHAFNASPSNNVYTYGNNGYTWLWGDGTHPDLTSNPITTHSFTPSGIYTVTLIVKDKNECSDTVRKKIKAFSGAASFTSKNTICAHDSIAFINTSVADTTIKHYQWTFGDGGTDTVKNPSHVYNITNPSITNFTVSLTITTALGCVSNFTKVIVISRPNASFNSVSTTNICVGDSVHFSKSTSYPGLLWSFGDGTTLNGTTQQPWHPYTTAGVYTITLTVTDSIGCKDTKSNAVANVQNYPHAVITSPAFHTPNLCYPYQATFTDNSTNANPGSPPRSWNLGTGQTVTPGLSVGTIYSTPGTYTITLVEITSNGCKDSTKNVITVLGPVADFTLAPGTICKGQSIHFNIKDTTDVYTWHWDFGDGHDTTKSSPVNHTFNFHPPGGMTNVTLVYWSSDSSCVQTKVYPINIYQVISDFNRNHELTMVDTAHCLGLIDHFYNISTNADSYGWVFSDGLTSHKDTVTHTFASPGTYSVELYIKNNTTGCVDTLVKKMYIFPPLNASAIGDSICRGSGGQVTASGGVIYHWGPAAGLSDTTIASPVANPAITTTYSVIATDANGCKDTAFAFVYVQQPPTTITYTTSIIIGQTTQLPGEMPAPNIGFTYTWTPTTDLSCVHCPTPVCSSTVDISYVEYISDIMGCFTSQSTFTVYVEPLSSVDVPTAFTPNGDGTNDVVYVAGWGIKKLNYFKIFNRWGELVFETTDIKVGWDGTYRGVPQNTETYVYEASVEPYIDSNKPVVKKGTIKLLR
jgi:gliding motility-associated-like protein